MGERSGFRAVRVPLVLTLAVALLLALRVVELWAELPQTMASHFAANGQPNDWMSRGGFLAVLGLVGGGTVALLFVAPWFLLRLPPSMVNLPNRDYWLATDGRRRAAIDKLASILGWSAFATAVLVAVSVELALRANLHRTTFENGPFLVCLVLYFVVVIAFSVQKWRAFVIPSS